MATAWLSSSDWAPIETRTSNRTFLCIDPFHISSGGIWTTLNNRVTGNVDNNPLHFSLPNLAAQIVTVLMVTRTIHFLLRPLRPPSIVSQIIGGILLGPSCLGRFKRFRDNLFPFRSIPVLSAIGTLGLALFHFLMGVKMDLSIIKTSGRRAVLVGLLSTIVPSFLGVVSSVVLTKAFSMDSYMRKALSFVGAAESIVAFPVVATLLTELRIINTEMGQLALSSSIINDIFNVSFAMVSTNLKLGRISRKILLYALSANVGYLIFVVFVIRPIMVWVVRNTPEGKPVKKAYIRFILVAALMSSFCSIIMGHNAYMGPLLLGLAVPDGPPLGSALVDRLDSFVSGLMLPLFLTVSGLRTNFYKIQGFKFVGALALVMLTANFGKLTAATLSLLYFKAPLTEALCLGFIMSSKGIVEMSIYNVWKDEKILDEGLFSVLVMSVALAATFMPMFATVFYNRSIEYADIRRQRNIPRHKQLRILVCILTQENVAIMIRMLQASNPSIRKPIHVCTLHLIQLVGRASPVLLCHTTSMKPKPSPSERIINVFHCFERSLCGAITFQAFSAMSPRELMHNDIWKVAHQEDISLIILPFHKTCEIGGTPQQASGSAAFGAAVRNLNLNVLATAPCSVGLIIDRGLFAASTTAMSLEQLSLRVAVIFLGGADDRGALLHASRMVEGPTTASLQVTQFILSDCSNPNDWDVKLDTAALTNFKSTTSHCKNVFVREEVVEDEEQMVKIIRSIHTSSDLILVGRRHTMESQIMAGIGEWSEFPELGVIGDVLASSDTEDRFSVLVWQHQAG